MMQADVTIVGAGIAGLTVARELARYDLRLAVVDKEVDVAGGSTKASSSIIHADLGAPGSATARFTVESNPLFADLCRDLAVTFNRCGELFVAFEGETGILEEIVQEARANGAVPFQMLRREEVLALEPNLNPDLVAGAFCPSGAVLNSFELAIALHENARANGVQFILGETVTGVDRGPDGDLVVRTAKRSIHTRYLVNAAGLFADEICGFCGDPEQFHVVPQRGQEVILDRQAGSLVSHVVFDCGLSLIVPTTHGNLLLGTTKEATDDKKDGAFSTHEAVDDIVARAKRLVPAIERQSVIRSFAGLRACNNYGDHYVAASARCPRLVTVSLQTGGLTASLSAARKAVEALAGQGLVQRERADFVATREPIPVFRGMEPAEQAALIADRKSVV